MPQRQLLITIMSEDEASGSTHQRLQAQNQWWLPCVQAAYCSMLLPCKALSGEQVSCTILPKHQAQATSATASAQASAGSTNA